MVHASLSFQCAKQEDYRNEMAYPHFGKKGNIAKSGRGGEGLGLAAWQQL